MTLRLDAASARTSDPPLISASARSGIPPLPAPLRAARGTSPRRCLVDHGLRRSGSAPTPCVSRGYGNRPRRIGTVHSRPGIVRLDELSTSLRRPTEGRATLRDVRHRLGRRRGPEVFFNGSCCRLPLPGPPRDRCGRRRHFRRSVGDRRRHAQDWVSAHPAPRHRRAGVEATLPRRPAGRVRRAQPRPIRAYRRGLPRRRCRRKRLDGRAGLGGGLPEVLDRLRLVRGGGEGCTPGPVARRVRRALALAPRGEVRGRGGERCGRLPHQGEHQPERHAYLPRAGRTVLRSSWHRSKSGNSSLHTRAGLSRGTQCSGSGCPMT